MVLEEKRGLSLRRNIVTGVISSSFQVASIVITYPLCLHYLGYETFGLWLLLSGVLVLAGLGDCGLTLATAKLIAEEHQQGNLKGVSQYAAMSFCFLFVSGCCIGGGVFLGKWQILALMGLDAVQSAAISWTFVPIACLIVLGLVWEGFYAILSGLGRLYLGNYLQVLGRFCYMGTLLFLLPKGLGIEGMLYATAMAIVPSLLISCWIIFRLLPIWHCRFDLERRKKLSRFAFAVFLGNAVAVIFTPVSRMLLARFGGVAAVPVFDLAFRGAFQFRTILELGLRALMTEGSRLITVGKMEALARLNRIALRWIFLSGVPVFSILFLFIRPILKLWLGEAFNPEVVPAFQVMLAAVFLSLLALPMFHLSMGAGRVGRCFGLHCINSGFGLFLILSCGLIQGTLAPLTMAWCVAVTYALSFCFMVFFSLELLLQEG